MITSDLLEDEADLIDLIDKFMARLPDFMESITRTYAEKNQEEFSGLIHQLKGVGGGYGYPMLTEICARIEEENKAGSNLDLVMAEFTVMCEEILAGSDENHRIAEANT